MSRNSPDLNPIENLWPIMKDNVAYKESSSAENLRQTSEQGSLKSPKNCCESLVYSMLRRIQADIDSKGRNTEKIVTLAY